MTSEKCVLITGATGGLGRELCRELCRTFCGDHHCKVAASKPYTLALVGRSEAKLEQLAQELTSEFEAKIQTFVADFAQENAAEMLVKQVHGAGLQVDILVNNAGFGYDAPFITSDIARQRELLLTNNMALMELCYAFAPDMAARKSGAILNVASVAGFMPGPYLATYYASKAFVQSFTQALHVELFPYGVHVSALCPGPVDTPFWNNAHAGNTVLAHMTINASCVARGALRALKMNKALCCPGLLAKSIVFASRLVPRQGIARIAARLQKPDSAQQATSLQNPNRL